GDKYIAPDAPVVTIELSGIVILIGLAGGMSSAIRCAIAKRAISNDRKLNGDAALRFCGRRGKRLRRAIIGEVRGELIDSRVHVAIEGLNDCGNGLLVHWLV